MNKLRTPENLVKLDASQPVWDRCFMVAPLVLVGTRDADGSLDLAPKHMAFPMGWQNYYGFVCSPTHHTYTNINRTGEFTVSYPKPSQVLYASLAASPRPSGGPENGAAKFRHVSSHGNRWRVYRRRVPVSRMQAFQND